VDTLDITKFDFILSVHWAVSLVGNDSNYHNKGTQGVCIGSLPSTSLETPSRVASCFSGKSMSDPISCFCNDCLSTVTDVEFFNRWQTIWSSFFRVCTGLLRCKPYSICRLTTVTQSNLLDESTPQRVTIEFSSHLVQWFYQTEHLLNPAEHCVTSQFFSIAGRSRLGNASISKFLFKMLRFWS